MLFEKRENVKPYEYPQLMEFAKGILESFWTIDHFEVESDLRQIKVGDLTPEEVTILERCMLSINVVENKVKSFWSRLDMRFPKPEVGFVGSVFGSNEVVHAMAYSELLEQMGLSDKFKTVMDVPCMKGRSAYLTKYLKGVSSRSNKEFTKSLILFTLLVENVSLFSQFLIMSSFSKYKNKITEFGKIVSATSADEQLHGQFGATLVNILRTENPEWFDDDMEAKIRRSVRKAFKAECGVLDWIFEEQELDFLPKKNIKEFLKNRFNYSLNLMQYDDEYEIDSTLLDCTKFFDRIASSTVDDDFFHSTVTSYSKGKCFEDIF